MIKRSVCIPLKKFFFRLQVDQKSPKKIRYFTEFDDNPVNTIIYKILIKHREIKMISDGNKIISVESV